MWNNELWRSAREAAARGLVACLALVALGIWVLVRYRSGQARLEGLILFGGLAAMGLWLLPRFVIRWSSPDTTPAVVALSRRSSASELAEAIAEEFEDDSSTVGVGWWRSVTISDRWLLHRRAFGIDLVDLDELAWAYTRVVRHYNWWIPIGADHSVVLRVLRGDDLEIGCRKQHEPPRDCRRLQSLRGWSHVTSLTVFPRSA
jgi:hypothetical protein